MWLKRIIYDRVSSSDLITNSKRIISLSIWKLMLILFPEPSGVRKDIGIKWRHGTLWRHKFKKQAEKVKIPFIWRSADT